MIESRRRRLGKPLHQIRITFMRKIIKIPAGKNGSQDDMRTWYLANTSFGYCRYKYILSNMIQGRETNINRSRRLCIDSSSSAQQVRPNKIQTTNLYTPAPPFHCVFSDNHVVLTSSVEFTAAGRHRGDLTAVTQALLSLNMLIPRQPNRPGDTNRYVTTGATVLKQESFVFVSYHRRHITFGGLHINVQYNWVLLGQA